MKNLYRSILTFISVLALVFSFGTANAKVEGNTIILGAAVSLTGKYSTNGLYI